MKNKTQTDSYRNLRSEIFNQNNANLNVRVEAVQPWKDDIAHDTTRRQRQDLFDKWGQGAKSHLKSKK